MSQNDVRALRRGLSVLSALSQVEAISLHDLHGETGLPKPTLLRLLATLESEGYAGRRLRDGLWRRTARDQPRTAANDETMVLDHCGPILRDLCKIVHWPSDVAVYDRGAMKVIETTRALSPAAFAPFSVYGRLPVLSSGLGRAWLTWGQQTGQAASTDAAAGELTRCRPEWRLAAMRSAVHRTRQIGYGRRVVSHFRHLGQQVSGDIGAALPILGGDRVVGVVNIMWYLSAMDEATFVRRCLPPLQEAAAAISSSISHAGTAGQPRSPPFAAAGHPWDAITPAATGTGPAPSVQRTS